MFCCLFTDYIFVREQNHADGSMQMEACGSEHVDRRMGMGACKWECGDGNEQFFSDNLFSEIMIFDNI